MSQDTELDIVIYQQRSDPVGVPEGAGAIWINLTSGAFFVSKETTDGNGVVTLEWFKEGQISETQFRQLFDSYAPLANAAQLATGTDATRISLSPALLKGVIETIAPKALTQEKFNDFLNVVSPVATKAEAEEGTSIARRDFTPKRIKEAIDAQPISANSFRQARDAGSFNPLDKLLVLQPIEEARPQHSNLENFSKLTTEGVTIDQDGTPPDDFVARTYDNRAGSANPNQTVYMLTTEGVVNAYTPQMQMEEGDAGRDLPDTSRKTLVLTDQNGNRLEGALFIDPNEPKIILLLPVGEYDLTLHFGRSRTVEASYREIPPASVGRVPIGFLKMRGERGYQEVGGYIFDVLAPDRDTLLPNRGTINRMRLKITALQTLDSETDEYTGHLNLFLADLGFVLVPVGQEVAALPTVHVDERVDERIHSQLTAAENRLQGEIDELKESSGGPDLGPISDRVAANETGIAENKTAITALQADSFNLILTGISLPLTKTTIPAVGANFNISMVVEGADHAPAGDISAVIDGQPLTVDQPSRLANGLNSLTVSIGSSATRGNILRRLGDNQVDFQIRKGNEYSNILHVPVSAPPEEAKYIAIPQFRGNFAAGETIAMASFTGLTIGKLYDITIEIAVTDHGARDRFDIVIATQAANPEDAANKYYKECYTRNGNASEQTFSFILIAKATTLVILGSRTAAGDATLGVVSGGLIVEESGTPTRLNGTNFSA